MLGDVTRSLGAYLKAQVQNAAIVFVLYIAGFAITGVPWWFLTGFFCGLLNLIPHLGPVLALAVPLLLKWLAGAHLLSLVYVLCAWFVIQVVDGFVLGPRAAGHAGVNPLLSIFLTIAAGILFGPLGMILAVPVYAVIRIVTRAVRASAV